MSTLRNLLGARFGKLTVIGRAPNQRRHAVWICQCDCGSAPKPMRGDMLRDKKVVACGCERGNTTHGGHYTPEWISWRGMLTRCSNPKWHAFKHYGGRGIKVCARWRNFANFRADMGERPAGMTIDRINVNGDYEPANCRWADSKAQRFNQRKENAK